MTLRLCKGDSRLGLYVKNCIHPFQLTVNISRERFCSIFVIPAQMFNLRLGTVQKLHCRHGCPVVLAGASASLYPQIQLSRPRHHTEGGGTQRRLRHITQTDHVTYAKDVGGRTGATAKFKKALINLQPSYFVQRGSASNYLLLRTYTAQIAVH